MGERSANRAEWPHWGCAVAKAEMRPTDEWLAEYSPRIDNVRAALDWAFSPNGRPRDRGGADCRRGSVVDALVTPGGVPRSGRAGLLGSRAGTIQGDDEPIPAFAAEPSDKTSVTLERSLLGWPALFSLAGTYLSGPPTTWLRHLYYRLSWIKDSGARQP
jgi:hypothetical protein